MNRRWGPNFDETLPVGNGTLLEFSETGFVRYFRGQQIQAGTYSLSADTTTFNTPKTRITFLANGATHNQLLITSDTAIVFQEYNGNESNLYKRWQ